MFTIWLCGLFIIHPTSAYLGPFICLCYDRHPLFFLFFAFETAACVLTAECHSDKGWRTFGSRGKCSYRLMFVVFHFVFFDPSADAGCCLLMVRLLFLTGFRENGRRVQRPGRNGHRWSRGGLPQYDRLQKGKSACAVLSVRWEKDFAERQWPVYGLLTAHWSVWMCIYLTHTGFTVRCQEASFHCLTTSSCLFGTHFLLLYPNTGKPEPSKVLISFQSLRWMVLAARGPSVTCVITTSP